MAEDEQMPINRALESIQISIQDRYKMKFIYVEKIVQARMLDVRNSEGGSLSCNY